MSHGNKASTRGQGPYINNMYCDVPGTLHVDNVTKLGGVQSTPGLYLQYEHHFYKMLTKELHWPQSHQTGP